jgi:hypothetical protein
MQQAANLGDAHVPAQVAPAQRAAVTTAYHQAFVFAYGRVMKLSGALALLAAVFAAVYIRPAGAARG